MRSLTRRLVVGVALGGATLGDATLGGASAWAAPAGGWPAAPGDMNLGNPKAPVRVVQYLSLSCPHCAHFNADVFPAFKAKYVDTGRVFYTVRELLTPPAQVAAAGFLLARCDGGANYVAILDQVFRSQPRWRDGGVKAIFLDIARANGIGEGRFEACLTDPKALADLDTRLKYANEVDKVTSTPAFFINGAPWGGEGVPSLAQLGAAVAKAARSGRR